jgi:hypothetical protein
MGTWVQGRITAPRKLSLVAVEFLQTYPGQGLGPFPGELRLTSIGETNPLSDHMKRETSLLPDPAQYTERVSSQPPETSTVIIESSGTASSINTKAIPVPAKSPLKERKSELPISRFCLHSTMSPSVSDSSSRR